MTRTRLLGVSLALVVISSACFGQNKIHWNEQEQPIVDKIKHLRDVPDDQRGQVTVDLAKSITELPGNDNKVELATALAGLSTEGDFGQNTLQTVATMLQETLRQHPMPEDKGKPSYGYYLLAQLVRYEHVSASLDNPQYATAMANLEADDQRRANADFTLTDLDGHKWTLRSLHGKVVLVNFWATWCPPCRKELPDLQTLSEKFKDQGLVVLAISDEEVVKVKPFVDQRKLSFPILLDDGDKVEKEFAVEGIPKSFVYDREGKLVAQAIDMRTQKQFLEMLQKAGLK
jgi:peroxiredoxin